MIVIRKRKIPLRIRLRAGKKIRLRPGIKIVLRQQTTG